MSKKKHYQSLEVNENASKNEIEEAYKKLVLKWHPNLYANKSATEKKQAEEKMKEINQAYEVLGNEEKRKNYDRFGNEEGFNSRNGKGGGWEVFEGDFSDFFKNFSDVFDVFGDRGSSRGRGSSQSSNYRKNISINLTLSFKESIFGCRKIISFTICSNCRGKGVIHQESIFGGLNFETTCSRCKGAGEIAKEEENSKKENISFIDIPRGLQPDERINFRDEKNKRNIYVNYKVKESSYFIRKGNDIHVDLPISFLDAILGNRIKVITLEGIKEVIIPPRTQNGDHIILSNNGCYLGIDSSRRGDLLVWLQVKLPINISSQTEKILRDLQGEKKWNPNQEFVEKNKDIIEKDK